MADKNKNTNQNVVQKSEPSSTPSKKTVDMNAFMASGRKIAAKHEVTFNKLAN